MSFERQRSSLVNALAEAGLGRKAAANIADIICNSQQELHHSGPIVTDSTPASMRQVTPEARKYELPNLDFRDGDPDFRRRSTADSEQRTPKQQQSTVSSAYEAPQQTDTSAKTPDAVADIEDYWLKIIGKVDLKGLVRSEVSSAIREAGLTQAGAGTAGQSLVDLRSAPDMRTYSVLTGAQYIPGVGIKMNYETITALNERRPFTKFIRTQEQKVLTGMVNDSIGPRAHAAKIDTFSLGTSSFTDSYFNVFRVGTFTGDWAYGDSKNITQVWPEQPPGGGSLISVKNYFRSIPSTSVDGDKYVLFAARTQDEINQQDGVPVSVRGEDETVVTKNVFSSTATAPVTEWYALSIQVETQDCEVFDFLLGKRNDTITGYDVTAVQSLGHDYGSRCVKWLGQEIDVVTGVSYAAGAISVTKTPVTVLGSGSPYTSNIASLGSVTAVQGISLGTGTVYAPRNSFYAFSVSSEEPDTIPVSDCDEQQSP